MAGLDAAVAHPAVVGIGEDRCDRCERRHEHGGIEGGGVVEGPRAGVAEPLADAGRRLRPQRNGDRESVEVTEQCDLAIEPGLPARRGDLPDDETAPLFACDGHSFGRSARGREGVGGVCAYRVIQHNTKNTQTP